jgi:putative ABC transport system ATP-binding protein
MSSLVKLFEVKKSYINDNQETPVLHGVSLEINSGEFVALMGPSGSGKSTLMHIIGFLDRLSGGVYEFNGTNVSNLEDNKLAKLRCKSVGFVFQAFNLLANTSVLDNVMLPMIYTNEAKHLREIRARQAIESVGLSHRETHLSNQLSGGEKQRVAIARALVNNPDIILADEPTGNLDSKSGTLILETLRKLNNDGKTIIMVTHEEEAAEYAGRIIKMRDGLVVSDTTNANRRAGEYKK